MKETMIDTLEQLDLNGQYTYADYLKWHFKERLELIRGYIYKMSPAPSRRHQSIVWNLNGVIWSHLRNQPCQAYSAPFDVRLPIRDKKSNQEITTVLQPDICIICDSSKLDDSGCLGVPDLVVEVLSTTDSNKAMKQKFDVYEENGVKEYWAVYPAYEHVMIFILNNSGKFIGQRPRINNEILQSTIFPELTVDLSEIFTKKF